MSTVTTTVTVSTDHVAPEFKVDFQNLCRSQGVEVDADGFAELDCEASGSCTPGCPGCHTQRNGDPGWPEEPAMCEDLEVTCGKTDLSTWLTDSAVESFTEAVMEEFGSEADRREEARCEARQARYEMERDGY